MNRSEKIILTGAALSFLYVSAECSVDWPQRVDDRIEEYVFIPEEPQWLEVTATIYHAVAGQTDDTPFVTACGHHIDTALVRTGHERTLALSRDLLAIYPYGTQVEVSIDGHDEYCTTYVVRDCMNARYNNRIDLLVDTSIRGGKYQARIKSL